MNHLFEVNTFMLHTKRLLWRKESAYEQKFLIITRFL